MKITASIERRQPTQEEMQVRLLNARASDLKGADIAAAVHALREAQLIARRCGLWSTVDWWLRLPMFLQQAGLMDEAEQEFDRIEKDIRDGVWIRGYHRSDRAGRSRANRAFLRRLNDKRRIARAREHQRQKGKPTSIDQQQRGCRD